MNRQITNRTVGVDRTVDYQNVLYFSGPLLRAVEFWNRIFTRV